MRGPALVLDHIGLSDLRHHQLTIHWQDVLGMSLNALDDRILVRVYRSSAAKSGLRRFAAGMARMLRGGDIVIALDDVKYDAKALRGAIEAFMATRRSVAASPRLKQ